MLAVHHTVHTCIYMQVKNTADSYKDLISIYVCINCNSVKCICIHVLYTRVVTPEAHVLLQYCTLIKIMYLHVVGIV